MNVFKIFTIEKSVLFTMIVFASFYCAPAHAVSCREAAGTPDMEDEDWDHISQTHCDGITPTTSSTVAQDICVKTGKSQFAPSFCDQAAMYSLADKAIGSASCTVTKSSGGKVYLKYKNDNSYTGFDRDQNCNDVGQVGIIVNTTRKRIETMYPMKP